MSPERQLPKKEKGISIEQCISKAENYIKENGMCLFLFDVKNSRNYPNRQELQEKLNKIIYNLNYEFDQYFPENNLATHIRTEKGFYSLLGDGSWVGINNAEVIPKITEYLKENCSEVSFHYNVAKDGWDDKAMKTIK